MKIKKWILPILAFVLVLCSSVGAAFAYFTTYTTAKGGYVIHLGGETVITEPPVTEWTKHVIITSKPGSAPVFVRAIAYAPEGLQLTYSGDGWAEGEGGYWYYQAALEAEKSTPELLIKIDNIPEGAVEGENFNVIVVYESVPAVFKGGAEGNPVQPDLEKAWEIGTATVHKEGGN